MQSLDLCRCPLTGTNLIEASAGTGKTYTIAGLFLRLVLETRLGVDAILVVTFTEAATAELRDRIRTRLSDALAAFEAGESDEELLRHLLDRFAGDDRSRAIKRLRLALLGFDRAAICTIHGFCQRILRENAFESGQPFETELVPDESELLEQVVLDFWRREIQDLPVGLVDFLRAKKVSPQTLAQVRSYLNRPYLSVRGGEIFPSDLDGVEAAWQALVGQAQGCWQQEKDRVEDLLTGRALKKNIYNVNKVPEWIAAMDQHLRLGTLDTFDKLDNFTSVKVGQGTKKDCSPPENIFFKLCDDLCRARDERATRYQEALVGLWRRLIDFANAELARRKELAGQLSFDDLLLRLHDALTGSSGADLAALVRSRCQAALIDEFQDTDPLQYTIFHRLYGEDGPTAREGLVSGEPGMAKARPLFLVGDPKQAIYSFRGADVFAYLQGRRQAGRNWTLLQNHRSSPAMITGINALFKGAGQPFLFDWLPFHEAVPAAGARNLLIDPDGGDASLRLWHFLPQTGNTLNKDKARLLSVAATAAEIARLLVGGRQGQILIGTEPLKAGQIAVLVRKHKEGAQVADALLKQGIHSVQRSEDDVYGSREAWELELVLIAVLDPGPRCLPAALATEMLGRDGDALLRLTEDEVLFEDEADRFRRYHLLWQHHGFFAFFRRFTMEQGVPGRLLAYPDGERRLTNLNHLAELLQVQESVAHPGGAGLIKWFAGRRQDSGNVKEAQLRLESDEDLVQIVTIHKSKGLQYGVVFCPFFWDGYLWSERNRQAPYTFHEPADHRMVLELGSPRFDQDRVLAITEERAENLRLFYVAVTRARYRCYLAWAETSDAARSALGHLLTGGRLQNLAAEGNGTIQVETIETVMPPVPLAGEVTAAAAKAREFSATILPGPMLTSFSALAAGQRAEPDRPDHDALPVTAALVPVPVATGPVVRDIFSFPRGGRAGSCLHALFENLDFTETSHDRLLTNSAAALAAFGFSQDWAAVVAAMAVEVLGVALDGASLCLNTVTADRRLVELEFHYPLAMPAGEGFGKLLLDHWFTEDGPLRQAVARLRLPSLKGFMKGYVDLVFAAGDRYYLADYKSNWLGEKPQDYCQNRLAEAIAGEGYFLQYLFYTLALHRHLRQRLPDYDYDRHFGGCYYLFLRGIRQDQGPDLGVFFDRPPASVIAELDRMMRG